MSLVVVYINVKEDDYDRHRKNKGHACVGKSPWIVLNDGLYRLCFGLNIPY